MLSCLVVVVECWSGGWNVGDKLLTGYCSPKIALAELCLPLLQDLQKINIYPSKFILLKIMQTYFISFSHNVFKKLLFQGC